MKQLKKYLIAGLLVWLPFAATVMIIKLLINFMDKVILLLPEKWQPVNILGFSIPGFGVVLATFIVLLTGVLAANLFGQKLLRLWESILNRIPLVRSIYSTIKQISVTIFDSQGKSFRKVVMLEYPRRGIWSVGFLTKEQVKMTAGSADKDLTAVFIPTTPNPTSGFIILFPREDVTELNMSIEEGFKFIMSMGVIVPPDYAKTNHNRTG